MIINCECGKKKFNIDGSLIPKKGRLLKCGSCSKIWHYTPIIETKNDEELDTRINESVKTAYLKIGLLFICFPYLIFKIQ